MKTMFTKRITAVFITTLLGGGTLTGCSSLHDVVTTTSTPGYRHYDPCIRCGESWIIVPNQDLAALRQSKGRPGFTQSDYEAGLQEMYGPNWREVQKRAQSPR
jgi:hypothetical protein